MSASSMGQAAQITASLRDRSTSKVQRLIDNWDLLELLMDNDPSAVDRSTFRRLLNGQLETTGPGLPDWYVSPQEQVNNVYRWSIERNWGFADSDFPSEIPDFTPSSPLEVLVLAVYLPSAELGRVKDLPGYVRTASELWQIARDRQPDWWQLDELKLDADHLRPLDGITHTPGIRWVALDLGAHWNARDGVRPRDVRATNSAHAEILAAAAHFPGWIQTMDGSAVPYVWLPGYQLTVSGEGAWALVPVLSWDRHGRGVLLDASWGGNRYWYFAVPVVREL